MLIMITLFRTQLIHDRSMSPAIFVPLVGIATNAVSGATICNYASQLSPRLAVPVIITSYLLGGFGIWFTVLVYGVYLHRLLAVGYPEPVKTPTLFMLVSYAIYSHYASNC